MESYSVSELNGIIRGAIQNNFKNNKYILVTGEVSNLKPSGRNYFMTLKDQGGAISTVFWGKNLDKINNGDNVEVKGRVDCYIKSGNINLVGFDIKNVGIGALHMEYEKLYKKYEKLGYYNNKKDLPYSVKNVGIITSKDGAALQDLLCQLRKFNFGGQVYIYNCSVQGIKCGQTVADGIKYFNEPFSPDSETTTESDSDPFDMKGAKLNKVQVDIIVITRGGGSFEDLMGFSDPKIVEAINESYVYTISAIGHEVDNMLSDYVANYRAPTPSIAGEVLSGIYLRNLERINKAENQINMIKQYLEHRLYSYSNKLDRINRQIKSPYHSLEKKLTELEYTANNFIHHKLRNLKNKSSSISFSLEKNDPGAILGQGFSLFTDLDGVIIKDVQKIISGNKIKLINSEGSFDVTIVKN